MIQGGIRSLNHPLIPFMRLHVRIGGSDVTHGIINLDHFIKKSYLIPSLNMGFNMWCFKSMILLFLKRITGFKYTAKTPLHVLYRIFIGFTKSTPE